MATITLTNLQTNLPLVMNMAGADLPNADITRALNWAKQNLQRKLDLYWNETSTTIATVAGNRTLGPLPSDYHRATDLWIIDGTTRVQLGFVNLTYENLMYPRVTNETQKRPQAWYRRGKSLIVMPTPDKAYTVSIAYMGFLPDLVSGSDNDDITNNQDQLLLYAAAEYLLAEKGMQNESDWWAKKRAERERDLYYDMLEEGEGNTVIVSRGTGYLPSSERGIWGLY